MQADSTSAACPELAVIPPVPIIFGATPEAKMKRIIVLSTLITLCALSLVLSAQQPQGAAAQAPKVIEVEKLKDNLFVLRSAPGGPNGGGNTAVFVTSAGVVVVDAKNPGWGQPILDKIKELTPKPVTTL